MQSLQVKVNNTPIVFGGCCNSILNTRMQELGVKDFIFAKLITYSITPEDIIKSAEYIQREYSAYQYVFSVGAMADKVLKMANIDHGALPSSAAKDKKTVAFAMQNCRNYLLRRMYHAPILSGGEPLPVS
jgi:hypothetical protein